MRLFFRSGLLLMVCAMGVGVFPTPRSFLHPTAAHLPHPERAPYLVQAVDAQRASTAVQGVGGTITRELALINGVAALLDRSQVDRLRQVAGLRLQPDAPLRATGMSADAGAPPTPTKPVKETDTAGYLLYPSAATATTLLHAQTVQMRKSQCANGRVTVSSTTESQPLQGRGVTVAVIDSGFMEMQTTANWKYKDAATGTLVAESAGRCIVYRDFLPRTAANGNAGSAATNSTDQNGHGTHVVSTIADNRKAQLAAMQAPSPVGVAPEVNLLIARALDKDGAGSYSDVIAAIEWVIANQATYNVRVLNLSLYSPVSSPYWADPLNQAVMKAWQAGITVVVAAGNAGDAAATITVPGNVPYVISVGALKSGRYTASGDDELATYSSRGPTESAFIKPDVVVPASRTIAPMPTDSQLATLVAPGRIQEKAPVDYKIGKPAKENAYYQLSGTSMAAAEVSGIVALMLQANPTLTNEQVKYRLLATARAALDPATNLPIYTPWEQGAGLVDAQGAITSTATARANDGMDIALDLNPTSETHYWGYTLWDDATQTFQLLDPETGAPLVTWSGAGRTWSGAGRTWSGAGRTWSGAGRTWSGAGRTWSGGTSTWTGSDSLWAGAGRTWSGSIPDASLGTASHGETLVNDDIHRQTLPVVQR